jgi:formate hydrogenlyase subunit 3/multisubunit Na+/H+ antiporter MnhD subunit
VVLAVVALVAVTAAWLDGGARLDAPWAPTWNLRLNFEVDGLAALYGILAAGVGALVFTYASAYVPRHLAAQDRPRREEARLHGAMALFLVSMIGLVTARDLVALFVFWDLTAVASWLLISFDRHDRDARLSALMALLVTAISAVLMLVGILMLRSEYGTTQLDELFAVAEPGTTVTVACALIAVAALAKSAQVRSTSGCRGRWPRRRRSRPTCTRRRWSPPASSCSAGCTRCWPSNRACSMRCSSSGCARWRSAACSRWPPTGSSGCSPTRRSRSTATW